MILSCPIFVDYWRLSLVFCLDSCSLDWQTKFNMANSTFQDVGEPSQITSGVESSLSKEKTAAGDISHVERIGSVADPELEKDHMNYDRVDKELAKYAQATAIEISPKENKRLKRIIDKRVLTIMVFTYFLQALDKGTMSFASIMGIREDAHLDAGSNQVCSPMFSSLCL